MRERKRVTEGEEGEGEDSVGELYRYVRSRENI